MNEKGRFRRSLVGFLGATVLAVVLATNGHAQDPKSAGASDGDLAKQTQNPVADLITVPFQSNFNFGTGATNEMVYVMNVQPVIPFRLSDSWNMIARVIMPIINQPRLFPGMDSAFGLGDINPTFFFSPSAPSRFIWGAGPTLTFPTATRSLLGSGKWSAGPAAVGVFMEGPWVVGALANQQWSFAGWSDDDVNMLTVQPFVNYNLPHAWYVVTAPLITANWATNGGNRWTVPVGAGVGKVTRIGKLPVNVGLQGYYNAATPDFGSEWSLRFVVQLLFPKG